LTGQSPTQLVMRAPSIGSIMRWLNKDSTVLNGVSTPSRPNPPHSGCYEHKSRHLHWPDDDTPVSILAGSVLSIMHTPTLSSTHPRLDASACGPAAEDQVGSGVPVGLTSKTETFRRWTIVLISRDYPPHHGGGIATFVHALAHALQALGHRIHVICRSAEGVAGIHDEAGVMVHRIVEQSQARWREVQDCVIPQNVWRWSACAYRAVEQIAANEAIDLVEAPIWGCEGIAFLLRRRWPLVTSLHTTLHTWMESNPRKANSWFWQHRHGRPMLALERRLMSQADAIRANSQAILKEIEAHYGFAFDRAATRIIPHGLPASTPPAAPQHPDGSVELLFVGRLEQRKGIVELLQALPDLLQRWPQLKARLIGDTRIRNASGSYDMDDFLARHQQADWLPRVIFAGRVDDDVLQQAYADCDLFVAPSLFESFGLVFVEAMRQGKPVIGCQAGGMPEVIEHGQTGLLVHPGDSASLAAAIEQLLRDPALRARMGEAALRSYQQRFTAQRMALDSLPLYQLACQRHGQAATMDASTGRRLRISYLSAICKRHDAISNAVAQEIHWLRSLGHQVHLYTHSCNQPDLPFTRVRSVADFCLHDFFQHSDLVVCHFGIYFELFNAILCAPQRAKVLVVFHNITPKAFVPDDQHALIDRSFVQMANLRHADHVICVSPTNLKVMQEAGIQVASSILPLAVAGHWQAPQHKPSAQDGTLRLLFIGRFVRAKGVHDLLQALRLLLEQADATQLPQLELSMVGSLSLSDPQVVDQARQTVSELQQAQHGRLQIKLLFGISDSAKRVLLDSADLFVLPTYHEGFCVPIVEAISSGCRVVVYDNSNTPAISQGLAELVPTGDVAALAQALRRLIDEFRPSPQTRQRYAEYRAQAAQYAMGFREEQVRAAFLARIQALAQAGAESPMQTV
jgi:glycosyltransferase involved in cell wall biosynthesis